MKEIRIGVVGLGWWGQIITGYFRECPGVKIVALCDQRRNFPDSVLQDAKYYADMKEMFFGEKLDAAVVVTPPEFHLPAVELAAKRGIDVYCEKPMAHRLEDCDRMIRVCRKNKVKLMIAFKHRFAKAFSCLKEKSRNLGKPLWSVYTYPLWKVDDPGWKFQTKGTPGIIVENFVHAIDGLIYLMGDVERVYAEGNRAVFKHPVLPDSVVCNLRFKNGAIAALGGGCTSDRRISREYLDIHYEKGLAQIWGKLDYPFNLRFLNRDEKHPEEHCFEESDGVHEEISYFVECIRENHEPVVSNGEEGRKSLAAALAILKSIKENRVVKV